MHNNDIPILLILRNVSSLIKAVTIGWARNASLGFIEKIHTGFQGYTR